MDKDSQLTSTSPDPCKETVLSAVMCTQVKKAKTLRDEFCVKVLRFVQITKPESQKTPLNTTERVENLTNISNIYLEQDVVYPDSSPKWNETIRVCERVFRYMGESFLTSLELMMRGHKLCDTQP